MISRAELQRLANREKVALGILEKDYVLIEVLKALSQVPFLSDLLVFKGGTALRIVYFADWRYSEDLDFTVKHDMNEEKLRQSLDEWYFQVEQASQLRLTTKMLPKPNGYARVRTQFIGPLAYPGIIFMDLSFDEQLCLEPEWRKVLTEPFSSKGQKILAYPIEELLAEKMRSLLERGKSRDYYDVWRLLKEQSSKLDLKLLIEVLFKKLKHKKLTFTGINDFIPKDTDALKKYWASELEQQIIHLPSLDKVIEELGDMLDKLIAPYLNTQLLHQNKC
ncbi:MAG: nucleotidyl transferase AbiEii/AbiGii toxin family protein [Candidatus Atribacteria bacterium]|nr:nucleotidyl transferase AbiEii/AbiGii toxin family protein [Candidatus Atribacteria bacterium]